MIDPREESSWSEIAISGLLCRKLRRHAIRKNLAWYCDNTCREPLPFWKSLQVRDNDKKY
jgi:hypothetical protein